MRKETRLQLHALQKERRFAEMEERSRAIIAKHPKDALAWRALGVALKLGGKDGTQAFEKVVELLPNNAIAHLHLGTQLAAVGKAGRAIEAYNKAILLDPKNADIYNNLGNSLRAIGKPYDALTCHHKAISLNPTLPEGYASLGNALLNMAQYGKAVDCFKKALDLDPNFMEAYSNLIFAQDFMTFVNADTHMISRQDWSANYVDHLLPGEPVNDNDPDPDRKLRVGYVSGDFKEHSAARVFGSMIVEYDRSQFEVYCYSNNTTPGDKYTERFKAAATAWRLVGTMHDLEIERLIREDKIDILIDLSGHSALNRLPVFALHPAPVQITAWGYATATGLKKMDYFFIDPIVVPEREKRFFVEKVRYLPCMVGSYFPEPFPDVSELPAAKNGIVTFGCLNRLIKISDEAYATWVEVLKAVPNSRLLLKGGELSDEATRAAVSWHFLKAGIDADRIKMVGATPWQKHVGCYNLIDIALDPFPHGGGVTSMEGLMMGVPVICISWPTLVGRISESVMTHCGLGDWVARTADEYVQMAVRRAADLEDLAKVRRELRGKFQASIVGDAKRYVAAVEQEYRYLWREWCKTKMLDKQMQAA